jgi:hypothetical protein
MATPPLEPSMSRRTPQPQPDVEAGRPVAN